MRHMSPLARWIATISAGVGAGLAGFMAKKGIEAANHKIDESFQPAFHPERNTKFYLPKAYELNKEELKIHNQKHNILLDAWLIPAKPKPKQKGKPIMIFAHGFRENKASHPGILNVAKKLNEEGITCLLFDFQNHGKSGKGRSTLGIREKYDLHAVIDKAIELGYTDIGLVGISMGAAMALQVASERKEVQSVIADSAYSDSKTFAMEKMQSHLDLPNQITTLARFMLQRLKKLDFKEMVPKKATTQLGKEGCLVKFFHTEKDETTPLYHSQILAEAFGDPDALRITPADNQRHNHCRAIDVIPDEFIETIVSSMKQLGSIKRTPQKSSSPLSRVRNVAHIKPNKLWTRKDPTARQQPDRV